MDFAPTLLDRDLMTGTETWMHYDPIAETVTYETRRDVQGELDANKFQFNQFDERARWSSDVHNHVATIPDFLYYQLLAKFGSIRHNRKAWLRWLDDPDNRAFRTRPGKLSK